MDPVLLTILSSVALQAAVDGGIRAYLAKRPNVVSAAIGETRGQFPDVEVEPALRDWSASPSVDTFFEDLQAGERDLEGDAAELRTIGDLDVTEVRRTVTEAVRRGRLEEPPSGDPSDLLRGLGLLRDGVLLRAAAVLFGKAERLEFEMPQCVLRVARFRGTDRMEFLDNRQFNGNAFTLLADAERFLRDTLPIAGRLEPDRFERIDEPLYPPLASREALANALCHRDYSIGGGSAGVAVYDDRLEMTSSGSLHFGLTPAQLFAPHPSRPRNPLIARTFYRRDVIEEWGSGTLKMAELVSDAGLPVPEIEDSGSEVTVRFRHGRPLPPSADRGSSPTARRELILRTTKKAA